MKRNNKIIWGCVLLAVRAILILNTFGITNIDVFFDGWWTLFIIVPSFIGLFNSNEKTGSIIGIKMIFGGIGKDKDIIKCTDENKENMKNAFAAFSGQDLNFDNEVFRGAEITAVFGGVKLDLRNAVFEGNTVVNACCIFGGADILLPDNVNVKINSNSLFGGIDNKKHKNSKDNLYTVYFNGTCIFGGVDVK